MNLKLFLPRGPAKCDAANFSDDWESIVHTRKTKFMEPPLIMLCPVGMHCYCSGFVDSDRAAMVFYTRDLGVALGRSLGGR